MRPSGPASVTTQVKDQPNDCNYSPVVNARSATKQQCFQLAALQSVDVRPFREQNDDFALLPAQSSIGDNYAASSIEDKGSRLEPESKEQRQARGKTIMIFKTSPNISK